MSPDRLQEFSRKQLEHLARRHGVSNIRQLRKQDLIQMLAEETPANRSQPAVAASGPAKMGTSRPTSRTLRPVDPGMAPSAQQGRPSGRRVADNLSIGNRGGASDRGAANRTSTSDVPHHPVAKSLSGSPNRGVEEGDEIQIDVCDGCWLRVAWRIGAATRDRAVAALGPEWHQSQPCLRFEDVTLEDESERPVGVTEQILPAGTTVWFLRVADVDRTYRVSFGYRSPTGRWYQAIRSRSLVPARVRPVVPDAMEATEVAGNTVVPPTPVRTRQGATPAAAKSHAASRKFVLPRVPQAPPLGVELELVVRGQSDHEAHVELDGRPMFVDSSGAFRHQLAVQPGRHVVPIVATSADGGGERTVILAFEINTREMEPRVFDDTE